jgi:hypothetical protein
MAGLLGRELDSPTQAQPVGGDHLQFIRSTALQVEGSPVGFTTYRPADITGTRPVWEQFVRNYGDIDDAPVGIPMGPRHFSILARSPMPPGA